MSIYVRTFGENRIQTPSAKSSYPACAPATRTNVAKEMLGWYSAHVFISFWWYLRQLLEPIFVALIAFCHDTSDNEKEDNRECNS